MVGVYIKLYDTTDIVKTHTIGAIVTQSQKSLMMDGEAFIIVVTYLGFNFINDS